MEALIIGIICVIAAFVVVLLVNASRVRPTAIEDPLPSMASTDEGGAEGGVENGAEGGAEGGVENNVKGGGAIDEAAAVERFRALLRCPTVWGAENPLTDHAPFDEFLILIKSIFPTVFENLELTMVETYGIMLRWTGSNPALEPIILMAHYDVVEANPAGWTHDPFGAEVVDGRIYARGTLDTKCILSALLEAVAALLAEGYVPPRDIYLCSSNCEEDTGPTTRSMVGLLAERGIKPFLVLDEGGAVIDNPPLVSGRDFALIGVAEKGLLNAHITVSSLGGHSSTPSPDDAPAKLVRGLDSLLKHPPAGRINPAVKAMLRELAAYGGFGLRLVLGNLWLTKPIVMGVLTKRSESAAMVRSTYALTELEGSKAVNIIPHQAKAVVNVRIDPAESVDATYRRIKACFKDDEVLIGDHIEPSPVSPFDDEVFAYLRKTIHAAYPEAGIAPYVQNGRSDACYFAPICPHTYRFGGFLFKSDQRGRVHGQDENIDVQSYLRGISFYLGFLRHLSLLGS